MTQDEIIRMAREAGFNVHPRKNTISSKECLCDEVLNELLERFTALVAAHFQKKLDYAHQTIFAFEQKLAVRGYENQIASLEQALSEAVLAEREACAKVCDGVLGRQNGVSAAIRARGEK